MEVVSAIAADDDQAPPTSSATPSQVRLRVTRSVDVPGHGCLGEATKFANGNPWCVCRTRGCRTRVKL